MKFEEQQPKHETGKREEVDPEQCTSGEKEVALPLS